jgi:CRISPR-associated endonuclease/helicase Cas3
LCFEIVKRHHGNLKNVRDEALAAGDELDLLASQWASIPQEELLSLYTDLLPEDYLATFDIQSAVKGVEQASWRLKDLKVLGVDHATVALYLYSVLLSADKEDASQLRAERTPELLSPGMVEDYRRIERFGRDPSTVNSLREEVFREAWDAAEKIDLDKRILSLNAPTGSGKTLAALGFALRLRERIRRETGVTPRIVYAISFISVIDQNHEVFEKVYKASRGCLPPSSALLKHHHLADYRYTTERNHTSTEDDEDPETYKRGEFMVEGWNSELIVTTFVQLFLTFLGGVNRSSRKMHTLANSIILLDEVQTIGHRHWLLVNRFFEAFSRIFHTYFVFITATMPMIFSPEEVHEIHPDRRKLFGGLDRVELLIHREESTIEEFVEQVCRDVEAQPDKRFLIVVNTVKCCQNVFKGIRERLPGLDVDCLSTVIPPVERIRRIERAKCENGARVIVSTQLVEAGVDLDVDIVYRDYTSLDSLNQVAGRCNRSGRREKGSVHVVTLRDEREKLYYRYVYDSFLTEKTKQVLEGRSRIGEAEFLQAVDEYYHLVSQGKSDDESLCLLKHLSMEEYEDLRDGFQLFEEAGGKIDVFIELGEDATRVYNEYKAIRELPPRERKTSFLEIKRSFYEYVISVPERFKDVVGYSEETRLGFVSRAEVDKKVVYNIDAGFCVSGESSGGTIVI